MTRLFSALFVILAFPLFASAHGLGIEAKLKDGALVVELFFDDDTPAKNAHVSILEGPKTTILEGQTDDRGVCTFAIPKPGKYSIHANAGDGHLAKSTITIPEDVDRGTISDGPTRESFTGPMRWLMACIGVLLIGGLTVLAKWATRKREESSGAR